MRTPSARASAITSSMANPASPDWRARRLSALRAASDAQVTTNTPPSRTASNWRSACRSSNASSGACAAITLRDCSTSPVNGANQNHRMRSPREASRIASTATSVLPEPVGACSTTTPSRLRASSIRSGVAAAICL